MIKLNNGRIILLNGDCLHEMKRIKPNSIDMVFADLPYGTTQNKWDSVIPLDPLWRLLNQIAKQTAAMVFTAQTPFDKVLAMSNLEKLKYEWIWQKDKGTGHLNAQRQPMRDHENVLVFADELPHDHILTFYRQQSIYNPQFGVGIAYEGAARVGAYRQTPSYSEFGSNNICYDNPGIRYPKTVLQFAMVGRGGFHPTQKPVDLMEYLIKTYTHEGNTVLDPTMGSGTTGVACVKLGRKFIGIEKDQVSFDFAVARISQAVKDLDQVAA